MTEPCASSTARLTMFSDAISSISCRCRPSSPRMAAATSGSACSSVAVKNESGAEAVLAEAWDAVIGEISPPPQPFGGADRRSKVAVEAAARGIAYRREEAKLLRLERAGYARYGG